MKNMKLTISSLLLSLFLMMPLSAVTIKMGSLFPEGTEWDRSLRKIAQEWKEISDGRVNLKIYAGGIAGSEEDMVRKMRIGQLDAAVLTSVGMNKIVSDCLVFSLPFFIQNEEELDFALKELTPIFDDDFNEKGFEVLLWSKSGWINFFSRQDVLTPEDIRKTKMGVSPGDEEMFEAFKALNFNVVPLNINDTLMGLQSGMIDTVYTAPIGAAAYQWFALANHMNPIDVLPVIGGIVLSERAWKKIPAKYHEELKASMRSIVEEGFAREAEKLNGQAMDVMKKNGLVISDVTDEDRQAWYELFAGDYWMIVGNDKAVSPEVYKEVKTRLEAFRAGQ